MKLTSIAVLLGTALLTLTGATQAERHRNTGPAANPPTQLRAAHAPNGTGLAPTTWGFTSQYSGTLYGTGYYPFRVGLTYGGTNSMYGYTFNYASAGFVNEIRAVYVFDISGLTGQPSPLWSAFMLDRRQGPAAGDSGLLVLATVNLAGGAGSYALEGQALGQGAGATDVDVYDAEDFENAAPFDTPEAAYSGNNTLIGSFALPDATVTPFSVNVSAAIAGDAPLVPEMPVPALGSKATAAIALLLVLGGWVALRRRSGDTV
jgi:hypothetical protein